MISEDKNEGLSKKKNYQNALVTLKPWFDVDSCHFHWLAWEVKIELSLKINDIERRNRNNIQD